MKVNDFFTSIDISASGLTAQRRRLDAISSNIANAHTTKTEEGGPYKRKVTTFEQNDTVNSFDQLLEEQRMKLKVSDDSHLYPKDYVRIKDQLTGVKAEVNQSDADPKLIYDPNHPDANEEGYVAMPDINIVEEMVDLISASRSYEANVTCLNAAKQMAKNALMI